MAVLLLAVAASVQANVSLDYRWGEGMVLQQGVSAAISGTAKKKDEPVSITYRDKTYTAMPEQRYGQWSVPIDPGPAGGPFVMSIKGTNTIELKNVTVEALKLADVLGEGMVLQRGPKAPVFGTAVPGDRVWLGFRDRTYEATAGADGTWRIDVVPGEAGGPFAMTVAGRARIELKQVYVGEVWLCSGQSNMRWGVRYVSNRDKPQIKSPNQMIRLQLIPQGEYAPNHPPLRPAGWQPADAKSVMAFSGTGYFFGAALQEKLDVPVGLIQSAIDATTITGWTPGWKLKELKAGAATEDIYYARQVRPLQPVAIRGVIWYQGEQGQGDTSADLQKLGYDTRLSGLIDAWRADWGQGDFPFLVVQLARIGFGAEQIHGDKLPSTTQRDIAGGWARVRDWQRRVLTKTSNVGLSVSYDLTTGKLHPPEKKAIGERLALLARGMVYGEKIEYYGPMIESAVVDGDEAVLTFTHAEGLVARDGPLRQLEFAPAGSVAFTPADAKIVGRQVRFPLRPAGDAKAFPMTVRYAYREWPDGNLYNAAGLPASPFLVTLSPAR